MAGRYDITIEQGATFTFDLQVQGINLTTGYTVRMQGRTSHAATTTVFSLTNASGITLTHSGQGHSHIIPVISATATAAISAPMAGVYDIEYQETSTGIVTRILEGTFYVTPEVTR
jgi:Na+/H+-dicarboxylate symporter